MTSFLPDKIKIVIRPVQHRDLDAIERLAVAEFEAGNSGNCINVVREFQQVRRWFGPLKFLSWFPNPCQHTLCVYVGEQENQIRGLIQVSPFNRTRSTWRVERVMVNTELPTQEKESTPAEIGSQLMRHCFETIWEARTWLLEVNIHNKATLALYRQNGFQPLAQLTYWGILPEVLASLATHEPDLPNLLPVSNADAQLLYQLDTVSMPPLVRQVYDRHVHDFKTSFVNAFFSSLKQWFSPVEVSSGYIFEPQRKAAIGYYQIQLCRDGSQPHVAQLTVHPAYTWLYPELLSQMARMTQDVPPQSLHLASADYQQEREDYLQQLGAERIEHTLLMSRSVWHKLREAKPISLEGLQLADMLQSLQPAHKPVPGRMSWLKLMRKPPQAVSSHLSASRLQQPKGSTVLKSQNSEPKTEGNHPQLRDDSETFSH